MDVSAVIKDLSEEAKIALTVMAQSTSEIIDPIIEEMLDADPQIEFDILHDLGFLDIDADEEDEEQAIAEFSGDVRQYLIEEIGRTQQGKLISKALQNQDCLTQIKEESPALYAEIEDALSNVGFDKAPDTPDVS